MYPITDRFTSNGDFSPNGKFTFFGDVEIKGNFFPKGNVSIVGDARIYGLKVEKGFQFHVTGNLTVEGDVTLWGEFFVGGDLIVKKGHVDVLKTLTVRGDFFLLEGTIFGLVVNVTGAAYNNGLCVVSEFNAGEFHHGGPRYRDALSIYGE